MTNRGLPNGVPHSPEDEEQEQSLFSNLGGPLSLDFEDPDDEGFDLPPRRRSAGTRTAGIPVVRPIPAHEEEPPQQYQPPVRSTPQPQDQSNPTSNLSLEEVTEEEKAPKTRRSLLGRDRKKKEESVEGQPASVTERSAAVVALEEDKPKKKKGSFLTRDLTSKTKTDKDEKVDLTEEDQELEKARKATRKMVAGGPIAIDLTPDSYKAIIALRALKRRWVFGFIFVATVCVAGLLYLYSGYVNSSTLLENERLAQGTLDESIAEYADTNDMLNERDKLQRVANQAAGAEIEWSNLINTITQTVPSNTTLVSFAADSAESQEGKNAVVVYVDFISTDANAHSASLALMQSVEGVSDVQISGMNSVGENEYRFSMAFSLDSSVYTNNYSQDGGGNGISLPSLPQGTPEPEGDED